MREMSTGFEAGINADSIKLCVLVSGHFDSGNINLWSGIGDVQFYGETYTGAGNLIDVSPITETQGLESNSVTVSLSGIPTSLISLALNENYQGRSVYIYLGVIDASGHIDAIEQFNGFMDVMEIENNGKTAKISVICEDETRSRGAVNSNYTSEDQKATYADDLGFDFVTVIQDKVINWGRNAA